VNSLFELNHLGRWSHFSLPRVGGLGIIHGFMTRSSNDIIEDPASRLRFTDAFGASSAIIMRQEHGNQVHLIKDGERPSAGDGIILLEKGVMAIIKTADCLPVILYDPGFPMAAIVHAGWRGTAARITEKALERMVALGAKTSRIGAIVGPGIGPCCYRVGPEVIADFHRAGFTDRVFTERDGLFFLDLKAANREMILARGIATIDDLGLCTSCRQDLFFSARSDKHAGRLVNFLLLKR